ncbi:hypothetical protein [Acrocarpospora catenulata]|uniref:hypothetical protein n=1 Tax=Acrocarpospora catenulata TaxID=2836182 RepID=UPI001BDA6246|nr:hypothetical protein [Acrocarpospora catenulata]
MKLGKSLAMLAVAAAAVAALPGVAEARTGAASGVARYVWVNSCPKKDYTVPCGPWTVTTRTGKKVALPDAQVFPVDAAGRTDKESSTTIALSGDGAHVAYFRKSDNRLVVRDLRNNKVRTLPSKAAKLPKGIGMSDVDTFLSEDGNLLVIDYFDEGARRPSLIVDVAAGTTRTLPGNANMQGFSPNGEHLLVTRYTDENTTEFAVFDAQGVKENSQVVPQIVANNAPLALSDDGSTVALIVTSPKSTQTLRVYDLTADTVGDPVRVKVAKNEYAHRLFWTGDDQLTLWELRSNTAGTTTGASAHRLDPTTGTTSVIDSFKIHSKVWTWWLPGE